MPTVAPLTGRDSELQIARNSLMAAAVGRGSLLLVSGPAGIGKTRFLEAVADEAKGRGFSTGVGVAFAESQVLYHAWNEALTGLNLDHLLREEPPPRLLALYVVSAAGLPVVRAERPGFSEDPALLAMMLNNASEFLNDAIRPDVGAAEGNLMRMAVGGRGVCIARGPSVALLAVYEGRETEIFLREVRHLLEDVMQRAGQRMENWDGNRRAVADLGEPLVASMMSGSFDGVDLAADGQARKFNLFDNVLFGLRRRSRLQPLLVVLDDLQWAEASSLGLLHYVARNTKDAPVLLVGAFRSEERETRPQLREALAAMAREDLADDLQLPRLLPEDTKTLAEKMLGAHKVPAEFFERLAHDTEGNPLIVREVVRQLQDVGALAIDPADGLVALTRPLARLEVPSKIREAVANRVAGLDSGDRELLDAAAVCGTRFSSQLLSRVVEQNELAVARRLNFLSRRNGLVLPEGGGWRFDHPVVREVIYDAIPGDLRVLMHREAGQILSETRGDEGAVGEHFAEAGDARAVAPLESASRAATERGAPYEAARLLEKAVRVAPKERKPALELSRAQALEFAAHYDEALASVDHAVALGADATKCALIGGAVLLDQSKYDDVLRLVDGALPGIQGVDAAKLLTLRARALVGFARFDEGEEAARKALEQAPDEDVLERANALMPLATSVWYRGGHGPALELFNEALRLRESKGDRRGVCEALLGIGGLQGDVGETQRALEFLRLALALAEKIGDRRLAAACRFNVSNALVDLGELEGSLKESRRAYEAAEAIGNERLMAWSEFIEGLILTRRGKPQDALIILDRAARRARKEGELRLLSMALSESVPPLLSLGEKRRALRDAAEALELAKTARAKMVEAVALRAQAEAAGADGDVEGMERYFGEAKALFETLRNTIEAAETDARWAEAMRAAGKPEEARAHWSRALQLFESRHLRRRSGPVRAALVALPS